jgi:hypothetical protein
MDPGTETCSQVTVLNRPYSVLLPVGFAVPPALPPTRCALTAPFHPCRPGPAISGKGMTGWSGGPFSVALSLGLHPPDVIRHRMSMEPGLSSRADLSALARAAVRPTDRGKHGEGLGRGQDPHPLQLAWRDANRASRSAISPRNVAVVEASSTPSTRMGRKCRWNAATASRVVPSIYPVATTP